jgi:hypothetical protein
LGKPRSQVLACQQAWVERVRQQQRPRLELPVGAASVVGSSSAINSGDSCLNRDGSNRNRIKWRIYSSPAIRRDRRWFNNF